MMYTNPVALNIEAHADLKISPSPNGYGFAANSLTVMLTVSEFFDAARFYPIIFSVSPEGQMVPVVLLGIEENENLFVDEDGRWDAHYIPAYVRRYPFVTSDGAEGQLTVCFDEAYDGFNLNDGISLFEHGEPTERMQEIQSFLHDYYQQMQLTSQFCEVIREKGLLKEISAQVSLKDGRKFGLNGLQVVDEEKLTQLSDLELVSLFRNGMLALIQAHHISLRNFGLLVDRKSEQVGIRDEDGF